MPAPLPPDRDPATGSPATTITAVAGLLGLVVSLGAAAYVLSLFLSAVSLAALPLALGDRPGRRPLRLALLGAVCAVLAIVLVLVPLLTGEQQIRDRREPAPRRVSLSAPVSPPTTVGQRAEPGVQPVVAGPAARREPV